MQATSQDSIVTPVSVITPSKVKLSHIRQHATVYKEEKHRLDRAGVSRVPTD